MGLNHTEAHNSVFLMQRLQSVFCWPFDSLQPFILSLYHQSFNTCGLSLLCNGFKCLWNFGRKHFQNKSLKERKQFLIPTACSGSATTDSISPHQPTATLSPHEACCIWKKKPRTVFQDVREHDDTGASHTSTSATFKTSPSTSMNADREVNMRRTMHIQLAHLI